jgi:hypothetical protein
VIGKGDDDSIANTLTSINPVLASLFDHLFFLRSLPVSVVTLLLIVLHRWYGGSKNDIDHETAPPDLTIGTGKQNLTP